MFLALFAMVGCTRAPGSLEASGPVLCSHTATKVQCATITQDSYPTEVSLRGVGSMSMGGEVTCGIALNGDVKCAGFDMHGLLSPPPGPWAHESTGHSHACALDAAGAPTCWGADYADALEPPTGVHLRDIEAGDNRTCGPDRDSDEWICWGYDAYLAERGYTLGVPPAGTAAIQAEMRGWTLFLLLSDGSIKAYGLPDDPTGIQDVPKGTGYVKLSEGTRDACALHESGRIECWGDLRNGQGDTPDGHYTDVAAGDGYTCGRLDDRSIHCWGCGGSCLVTEPDLP